MLQQQKKKHAAWNSPLLWVGIAIYGALLLLFGWQTWQFVNWLFPDDQLLAKGLTMFSFDVLAAFWALVHTFYRFASRGAKAWVIVAWCLTFVLALVASVLYLVIQFYFRFHISTDATMVNLGYAVSIIALVFNILALMSWLILEYRARNPRQDEFEENEQPEPVAQSASFAQTAQLPSPPVSTPQTNVPITGPLQNADEYLALLDKAVRFGQISEEKAQPLRDAIQGTSPLAPAPNQQNGAK